MPISLKKIQELSLYAVGSGTDGRGELCSAAMILGIRAVSCLCFLNSAMGSNSLIWMKRVLIEMGIKERIMFLWSLSFCWIFWVNIEGLNGNKICLICWSRKMGQVETMVILSEERNVDEQNVMYEIGSSGWGVLQGKAKAGLFVVEKCKAFDTVDCIGPLEKGKEGEGGFLMPHE